MDLHAWITQQVDAVEAAARSELEGRRVTFDPDLNGRAVTGTITAVSHGPDGLNLAIAQHGIDPVDEAPAPVHSAAAVFRRCEADRRILARHQADPDQTAFPGACNGCGVDDWGLPNIDNINDCPELLDLAHAHGITPDVLAGLDHPRPPEADVNERYANGGALTPGTVITTSDVPEALRGPCWKP
ncbi:hypothetical protein [Streptomyces sp. 5-6(2022)]|uniref:hypothetical protein n=1 Tax=Streptomyces sp. 5-6(2022) TaxID=2936510 RepID=UPI0023B9F342|nr:hypothetical protein [Streptomyces sp. 5-6(2022)]